jgi:hypothetical protein
MFSVPFRWGSLRVGIIGIANAQDGVLCNGWLSSVQAEVERERGEERRGTFYGICSFWAFRWVDLYLLV